MKTEDFSTIGSVSFTFSVSGFNVAAHQCVLFRKDTDANQDLAAAAQLQSKRICDQSGRLKPFDSVKSHLGGGAILCKCRDGERDEKRLSTHPQL